MAHIQSGKALKTTAGQLTIRFPTAFPHIPVVVVSPYWEGQNQQVTNWETVDTISTDSFTVFSGNAAPNYYVSWIATLE